MSRRVRKPRVFLSYAARDKSVAEIVSRALHDANIATVSPTGFPAERVPDALRERMRESDAYVVVASPEAARSPWTAFEMGAAMAWGNPVYTVLTDKRALPSYLLHSRIYDLDEISDLVDAIRLQSDPLTPEERNVLREVYFDLAVPTDKLIFDPDACGTLVDEFNRRSRNPSGSGRLLRELLQMRKAGRLRRLEKVHRSATAEMRAKHTA